MNRTLPILAAAAVLGAGACRFDVNIGDNAVVGSGVEETRSYDVESATDVQISDVFEGSVTVDPDAVQSVTVTIDDNLFDHVEVDSNAGELRVELADGITIDSDLDPSVEIVVTSLESIDISGATFIGVQANNTDVGRLRVSGASNLNVGNLASDHLDIDVSGASQVTASGAADSLTLDVSGVAGADLDNLSADSVRVDASGSSTVDLGPAETVTGDASGTSAISVERESVVDIETSGVASVGVG